MRSTLKEFLQFYIFYNFILLQLQLCCCFCCCLMSFFSLFTILFSTNEDCVHRQKSNNYSKFLFFVIICCKLKFYYLTIVIVIASLTKSFVEFNFSILNKKLLLGLNDNERTLKWQFSPKSKDLKSCF